MPDEQAWQSAFYYTLSTIAQTLAAAFGILSTFMLYRFQHAETKIEAHEENLSETVSTMAGAVESEALVAQLKEGDPGTVEEVVGKAVKEAGGGGASRAARDEVKEIQAAGEGISFWSAFHRRALRRLRHALLLTVSTIGFCLVQLPMTPLLARRLPLAAVLAATAVLLALVCLTMYARLILLLLVPEADVDAARAKRG